MLTLGMDLPLYGGNGENITQYFYFTILLILHMTCMVLYSLPIRKLPFGMYISSSDK